VERRRWNWPDEIRHQSHEINLTSLMVDVSLSLFDIHPSDRRLIRLPGGNCIRRHPPSVRSLLTSFTNAWPHDLPSRPEWLNSQFDTSQCSFRSARVYHSAAITNADLSPFVFRPFPSKDSQLWSLVRARRRLRRRPLRLDPSRKVPPFFPVLLPSIHTLLFSIGRYPSPSPSSPSKIHTASHNWSPIMTGPTPANLRPCQLSHPNLSS
jgi:hypothetical protein